MRRNVRVTVAGTALFAAVFGAVGLARAQAQAQAQSERRVDVVVAASPADPSVKVKKPKNVNWKGFKTKGEANVAAAALCREAFIDTPELTVVVGQRANRGQLRSSTKHVKDSSRFARLDSIQGNDDLALCWVDGTFGNAAGEPQRAVFVIVNDQDPVLIAHGPVIDVGVFNPDGVDAPDPTPPNPVDPNATIPIPIPPPDAAMSGLKPGEKPALKTKSAGTPNSIVQEDRKEVRPTIAPGPEVPRRKISDIDAEADAKGRKQAEEQRAKDEANRKNTGVPPSSVEGAK
jgi:hypothetical protein